MYALAGPIHKMIPGYMLSFSMLYELTLWPDMYSTLWLSGADGQIKYNLCSGTWAYSMVGHCLTNPSVPSCWPQGWHVIVSFVVWVILLVSSEFISGLHLLIAHKLLWLSMYNNYSSQQVPWHIHPWLSARLQYLQCIIAMFNSGNTADTKPLKWTVIA